MPIYILADDLGYGDVHCLNPQRGKIKTPHLDRLAAQSMVFTDAHAASSVCSPTRYGVLTGRYAWRTRLQKGVLLNESPPLIAPDRLTVPKLLKRHGYRTAGFGKWHLGLDAPLRGGDILVDQPIRNGPVTRGFDSYFCSDFRLFAPFMFVEGDRFAGQPLINRTKVGVKNDGGPALKPDDFSHILPTVCDRAVAKLGEFATENQPFFLYLAPGAPHDPYAPTEAWKGKSGLGSYADYVMETDAEIGRVLEALEKNDLATNTLIIFTSDNGCAPYAGVMHAQKYDPLTVIFNLGHSYRKLATLLDGGYVELGLRQSDVTINPFALEPTPENLHFLHAFVRVLLEGADAYRLSDAEDRELYEPSRTCTCSIAISAGCSRSRTCCRGRLSARLDEVDRRRSVRRPVR